MALRHFTLYSSLCAETIGATWEVRFENNMERVRAMIAPPSYLYEVSSARAPEGFHSVKEEPQRKDFQVDFPFENPTGYKKHSASMKPFVAPDTPIWVDFWVFSDQAQLLDPESTASKEPRSGLVA